METSFGTEGVHRNFTWNLEG